MCVRKTQPSRAFALRVRCLAAALLLLAGCGNQDPKVSSGSKTITPSAPNAEREIAGRPASQFVLRKDMFEALSQPTWVTAKQADWMASGDLVLGYASAADARAYPLRQMAYHHVVNDVVDQQPVLVTFCSLSGNALVFDRTSDGQIDEFGVAGWLQGTLLLYDKRTGSTWSQVTGRCLDGFRKGQQLARVSRGRLLSFERWQQEHADTSVMRPREEWAARYPVSQDWVPGASYVPAGLKPSLGAPAPKRPPHQLVLGFVHEGIAHALHVPGPETAAHVYRVGRRALLAWCADGAFDVRLFVLPDNIAGDDPNLGIPTLLDDGTLRVGTPDLGSVFASDGTCVSGAGEGSQLASADCVLLEDYAWHVHHADAHVTDD
jgi:hypothetical protein